MALCMELPKPDPVYADADDEDMPWLVDIPPWLDPMLWLPETRPGVGVDSGSYITGSGGGGNMIGGATPGAIISGGAPPTGSMCGIIMTGGAIGSATGTGLYSGAGGAG
jgi:hypothetical protein